MAIAENIKRLRLEKDWTQEKLADALNVSRATITQWERGWSQPRMGKARELAKLFNVTIAQIVNDERTDDSAVNVALYGSIAAGEPLEMQAVNTTYPIPSQMAAKYPDAFLLKVEGDSMSRILPNGCYALINPCDTIEHDGEPYAVCINGYDATIKRVKKLNNGFQLVPDSLDPTYKTETFNYNEPQTSSITVIGEVVYYVLPFDWQF